MEKVNQNAEIITKMMTKYTVIGWFPCTPFLGTVTVIYSIIRFGHVDVNILYLSFKFMYVNENPLEFLEIKYILLLTIGYHGISKYSVAGFVKVFSLHPLHVPTLQ